MHSVIRGFYLMIFCQVVLESFPISSSGHLVLLEKILKLFGTTPTVADLPDFFDHFLHGPTILVLLVFFRRDWFCLFRFLFKNFSFSYSFWTDSYKRLMTIFLKVSFLVLVSCMITTLSYFGFEYLKGFVNLQNEWVMLVGFLITALLLFSLYFKVENGRAKLTFLKVVILSLVQSIAFLPGVSRFGSVYVVSRWLGIPVKRAFQFTFLMQFPLILIAFSDASFKLLFETKNLMNLFTLKVNISFLIATVLAYIGLYISFKLARRKKLWYLGFYMLLPVTLLLYFIIF